MARIAGPRRRAFRFVGMTYRGCGETILVVEDEACVRRVVRAILRHGGYDVVEASDGEQALRHLRPCATRPVDADHVRWRSPAALEESHSGPACDHIHRSGRSPGPVPLCHGGPVQTCQTARTAQRRGTGPEPRPTRSRMNTAAPGADRI
ncbi:MAG TPA: response regulator [Candidatus Handelsmanbacteria bacterium]|nr:response regulator [Candidatus Handelsmanbacteria bacterium]